MAATQLTQEIVRELLDYNPKTGVLTWKRRHRKWFASDRDCNAWNTKHADKPAFTSINSHGCLHGGIFGKTYSAHSVIWLWQTGRWPGPEVDHNNRNRVAATQLTQEIVRELLDYNPGTGLLTWKHRHRRWFASNRAYKGWNTRYAGKPAFTAKKKGGHLEGLIFYKSYLVHRVIWLWQTGRWPDPEVDHENQSPSDNRWENLQEATHQQNMHNKPMQRNNTNEAAPQTDEAC